MALPPRVYYTLQEVTARWGCNIADVAGWAAAGKFQIMTGIGLVRCGEEIVAGRVAISPMDLMPMADHHRSGWRGHGGGRGHDGHGR